MMNLIFFISVLGVYGVASDEIASHEVIIERLEFLEKTVSGQQEVITNLQRQNTRLQSEVAQCKKHNDDTKEYIDSKLSKRFVLEQAEGTVAFTAAISPVVVNNVKDHEIIKFDTMVTSFGAGYNNQTGVFVAPISGIYTFSCSLLDHVAVAGAGVGGVMIHAEIVHNQRVLGRIFAHAETTYRDQGAQTVVAEVHQGDQVFVRSIDNPDLGLGGEFYSTFSGYLLQML